MSERPFCEAKVYTVGSWGTSNCAKRAKAQYDGKWLCGTHSPEAEAKRKAKSDERQREWEREWDERRAKANYRNACVNAFHDPAGRKIATEDIAEGVFWQAVDLLSRAVNGPWLGDDLEKARALLSFNTQEPENG